MATKPTAARGKMTRKPALRKAAKKIITGLKTRQARIKPGATDSATRLKNEKPPRKRLMRAAPQGGRPTKNSRPRGLLALAGAAKGLGRAGLAGAGMTSQAMKLAKKLKPSGRLSIDDMKKAKQMLSKRKGR